MKSAPSTPSPELISSSESVDAPVQDAEDLDAPRHARPGPTPTPHTPLTIWGLIDVVALVVATPVMLAIGVPSEGYLIGAGAWVVLRALGVAIDRVALAVGPSVREIGLRLAYLLGRVFGLAVIVIVVRESVGRSDGITALLVVTFAFTVELVISFIYRPKRR